MAVSLPGIPAIAVPFANTGDRNTIPTSPLSSGGAASLDEGFPPITAVPISSGGIPPSREDMNGLGYIATFPQYFLQMGGFYTFDSNVANAIGGYPLGAILTYYDSTNRVVRKLRSLKSNNTDNFITSSSVIGVSWQDVTPVITTGRRYFDVFYSLSTQIPFGAVPLNGAVLSADDYPGFYEEAVSRASAGTIPTMTAAAYANQVSATGQCGSFVINTTNQTVQVPTITAFIETGVPGTVNSAGVPNITGKFSGVGQRFYNPPVSNTATGAFFVSNTQNNPPGGARVNNTNEAQNDDIFGFDASLSNPVYGAASTVQPSSVEAILYMQVIEGDNAGGSTSGGVTSAGVIEIVSSGGYITSSAVIPVVSSGGYVTSSAVDPIVSSGGYVTSSAVVPIVSSGGFITGAAASGQDSASLIVSASSITLTHNYGSAYSATIRVGGGGTNADQTTIAGIYESQYTSAVVEHEGFFVSAQNNNGTWNTQLFLAAGDSAFIYNDVGGGSIAGINISGAHGATIYKTGGDVSAAVTAGASSAAMAFDSTGTGAVISATAQGITMQWNDTTGAYDRSSATLQVGPSGITADGVMLGSSLPSSGGFVALGSGGAAQIALASNYAALIYSSGTANNVLSVTASGAVLNGQELSVLPQGEIDSASTSAVIPVLSGGMSYQYTQPLSALSVGSVVSTPEESVIRFSAASGGITVSLPAELGVINGGVVFNASGAYIMAFRDGLMAAGSITM